MKNKFRVKSITFEWSESNEVKDNTIVNTFEEAEMIIFNIALNKSSGGYDKTKFLIEWEDGHKYSGRIDVLSSYTSGKELKKHIESHCTYFAGERNMHETVEEYESTLRAYGVSEEDQKEYRKFLDTYNLEDVKEEQEIESIQEEKLEASSVYYKLNEEKNGVEIYFTDKPDEETRNLLKANGFRWAKYNKCWYAKQLDKNIELAKQLSSNNKQISDESEIEYPSIDIDDLSTYTINQQLQDREHDSNWIFRNNKRDHNKDIQNLFTSWNEKTLEVIGTTENEYFIFKLKESLQRYKKKYHESYVKYLTHKANNPSWAVTGRGNLNATKYNQKMNRQDSIMMELANLPTEFNDRLEYYQRKIRKEEKEAVQKTVANTEIDITFKTETKEFEFLRRQEKKRVYMYQDYWICKLWGCFRIFKGNEEIHSMKTTEKLTDAKKYVCMLVNQKDQKAV